MKPLFKPLAGLLLAATLVGAPLSGVAFAQPAAAPAAEAAPAEAAPAEVAPAPAPATVVAAPAEAAPAAPAAPVPDKGDTAWMLISTVLVLMMIIPGLALFYGGLTRQKNMLSTMMQVSTVAIIGILAWVMWGYSFAFTDGGSWDSFMGGASRLFLKDVTPASNVATFSTGVVIPELAFIAFQSTFAAITAALVVGSLVERFKFSAMVVFAVLWPLLSYYPMAHMVWWWPGPDAVAAMKSAADVKAGLIWAQGAIDFAGGTVVHINAGVAALVGAIMLGKRVGYGKEPMPPHSLTLTLVGAGLLWVGWFGFNAGSNLESNGYAALATINTFVATAAAGLSWIVVEWITRKKPSALGLASGLVAGLVAITPAAGFAGPMGAIILGLIVSPLCIFFCSVVKNALKYDDSLDAFGIHGIGGMVGAIGTGLVVNPAWGGAGIVDYLTCAKDGDVSTCDVAPYDMAFQVMAQAKGVAITVAWSLVASIIVFFIIKLIIGLRASPEAEEEGLDISEHGERAYHS